MKKYLALALAAVLVLALVSCGKKDFDRDTNGYLTEEAAQTVAANDAGYEPKDVYFSVSELKTEAEGSYDGPHYNFVFTDSVAEYDYVIDAQTGAILSATGK